MIMYAPEIETVQIRLCSLIRSEPDFRRSNAHHHHRFACMCMSVHRLEVKGSDRPGQYEFEHRQIFWNLIVFSWRF